MSASFGLDVGGTRIKWAVVGPDGSTIREGQVATPRCGRDAVMAQLVDLVRIEGAEAGQVGLAMPGHVDTFARETIFIPNLPGEWSSFPIGSALEANILRPVFVLNDARAFAHGELGAGGYPKPRNAVFFTLGTGVGGAVARDGVLLVGRVDAMGEVGHTIVEPGGELCGCGGRGCLETVASGTAIVARAIRAVNSGLSADLRDRCGGDVAALTAKDVAESALDGDRWARDTFRNAGTAIGIAASNACVILQLDTVIIGGGLTPAFPLIASSVEEVLEQRRSLIGLTTVRPAHLTHNAGAVGAALYASASTILTQNI